MHARRILFLAPAQTVTRIFPQLRDAGVEVGLADGAGVPLLGIRGPLEGPGLMLHGAVNGWVDSVEDALEAVAALLAYVDSGWQGFDAEQNPVLCRLGARLRERGGKKQP